VIAQSPVAVEGKRNGLAESAGHENDGPSKLHDVKLAQKRHSFEAAEYTE